MSARLLAWHFLAEDRRLQHGSREVVEAGRTYSASGRLVMCKNGMHAGVRALNALRYAPGPVVCRVRLSGAMIADTDKHVAEHRSVLWMADATDLLHEFALAVAEDALGLIEACGERVDPRSRTALDVKRRWLQGAASNEELSAAGSAARAAWRTAWSAACAAESAAGSAAWSAAWSAAVSANNLMLETMLASLAPV